MSFDDASCPGVSTDPKLRPLGKYGGLTLTMALLPGSSAIDLVPDAACTNPTKSNAPLTVDERGVHRPQGVRCDAGAFEFARPTITISSPRAGAHYKRRSPVVATFKCSEGGIASPIASCKGTVPAGHAINTASLGSGSFTVTATDKSGNHASTTVHYTVTT